MAMNTGEALCDARHLAMRAGMGQGSCASPASVPDHEPRPFDRLTPTPLGEGGAARAGNGQCRGRFGVWGWRVVVCVSWFASWLERLIQAYAKRSSGDPRTHARLHMFSRLRRCFVWVVGILVGLDRLGIDLSHVALVGSALAVGLDLGVQNVVSNFVSGLILLFERSFKVGTLWTWSLACAAMCARSPCATSG